MKKTESSQIDLNQEGKSGDFSLISKKKRRWQEVRRGILIFLLAGAVLHASANIYASVLVNRQLSIVSEKGEPLTMAEMRPDVSDAQNAAPLYRQAYQAKNLTVKESNALQDFKYRTADFEARRPQILARNRPMFELLRQGAARPACSFDETWTQTAYSFGPKYYAEMRSLARLMRQQAAQEARAGDGAAALSDVRVIFQMADHMKNEPILIGFSTARSVDGIAHQALAEVLELRPLPAPQLQAFAANLPQTDWDAAFRRSLLGERSTSLGTLDLRQMYQASADANKMAPWKFNLVSLPFQPYMKMNEFYYLRGWRHYYDALQTPQTPLSIREPKQDLLAEVPAYAQFARIWLSIYSARLDKNRNQNLVMRNQRQNAFAIAAYRAAHDGAYPATLQQAATAWNEPLLPDPYGGKPFGYLSDGESFTLYSVGPNGVDDKGRNGTRERGYRLKNPAPKSADDTQWGTPKWAQK